MRMPTFSRHPATDTTDDERPTATTGSTTPVRERTDAPSRGAATVAGPGEATTTHWAGTDRAGANRDAANRDANVKLAERDTDRMDRVRDTDRTQPARRVEPVAPRPRASLLATLGLILAVASALLVLSGPLLGYGIGVAVLALILSLSGVHATGKRHVAGKSDALIGMFVALAAIVVGVLALTGSLSWLGTDMQPVSSLREWLDAQTVNRFQ